MAIAIEAADVHPTRHRQAESPAQTCHRAERRLKQDPPSAARERHPRGDRTNCPIGGRPVPQAPKAARALTRPAIQPRSIVPLAGRVSAKTRHWHRPCSSPGIGDSCACEVCGMTGASQVGPGLEGGLSHARIRFHGRSGQGMKTASRIVGAAALWEGCYARDSADNRPTMPR
jgi:hypothetical protein